jgi:opacity protein-like surface antigen
VKRLIAVAVALAALALPAAAQAHVDYRNVTINGSPWSNTYVGGSGQQGPGYTVPSCGGAVVINPGETKYIAGPSAVHKNYGVGVPMGGFDHTYWDHLHPFDSDWVTGAETRQWSHSASGVTLGSRRVRIWAGATLAIYDYGIKFVHQAGSRHAVVRANC